LDTIRNKTSVKVTQKEHPCWKIKLRRGKCKTLPRKTALFAAENRGP